jgi:hypothetical protein
MYGDFSLNPLAYRERVSRVLSQQGRVQLDSDANEQTNRCCASSAASRSMRSARTAASATPSVVHAAANADVTIAGTTTPMSDAGYPAGF